MLSSARPVWYGGWGDGREKHVMIPFRERKKEVRKRKKTEKRRKEAHIEGVAQINS